MFASNVLQSIVVPYLLYINFKNMYTFLRPRSQDCLSFGCDVPFRCPLREKRGHSER